MSFLVLFEFGSPCTPRLAFVHRMLWGVYTHTQIYLTKILHVIHLVFSFIMHIEIQSVEAAAAARLATAAIATAAELQLQSSNSSSSIAAAA